eukprot:SAG31_NODE_205_length_20397_cov_19.191152_14_plen_149_part_00
MRQCSCKYMPISSMLLPQIDVSARHVPSATALQPVKLCVNAGWAGKVSVYFILYYWHTAKAASWTVFDTNPTTLLHTVGRYTSWSAGGLTKFYRGAETHDEPFGVQQFLISQLAVRSPTLPTLSSIQPNVFSPLYVTYKNPSASLWSS